MPAPHALPIIGGVVTAYVAFIATSLYLHRSVAHRAVRFSGWLVAAFRLTLWLLTGIKRREWAAVHRRHHAFADSDQDPHSPSRYGYWTIQFLSIMPYRRAVKDPSVFPRYARDIVDDAWDRRLLNHGWLGVTVSLVAAMLLLGPTNAVYGAFTHITVYFTLQGLVNALCHARIKLRPRLNIQFEPTNRRLVALLTAGEGLHENHHNGQALARMSFRRGEVDWGWNLIALLQRTGQAHVLQSAVPKRRMRRYTSV